jgi:hypothetical protein
MHGERTGGPASRHEKGGPFPDPSFFAHLAHMRRLILRGAAPCSFDAEGEMDEGAAV